MIQEYVEMGPIHISLPGAMKLKLGMIGDRVKEVETQFGYLSRSIEQGVIGLPHARAQLRVSRVEPESALILDRLFSEVIEKISSTQISERAIWIREITSSLSELNGFLRYLSNLSRRLGNSVLKHIILKHRESLLDLVELLTGSRYGYYYLVPGGARYDLTDGFQERLERWLNQFRSDLSRIEALFLWTHSFQNRLQSMGRVIDQGRFGFVSEAAVESSRYGPVSHVESRLLYALKQCAELSEDLNEMISLRATGESSVSLAPVLANHEESLEIETARGNWALRLVLEKNSTVKAISISTPSDVIREAIAPALLDEAFEDVPLVLESLNFSIPEIDR